MSRALPTRRIVPVDSRKNQSAFANANVESEYLRLLEALDEDSSPQVAGCLSAREVLRAHFLIADFFFSEGSGMGGLGPRDIGLLHSAVHRQHVGYGSSRK